MCLAISYLYRQEQHILFLRLSQVNPMILALGHYANNKNSTFYSLSNARQWHGTCRGKLNYINNKTIKTIQNT